MTLRPGVHTVPTADRDGITALMRGINGAFEKMGPVLPLGPGRKQPAALDGWSPFGPRGWLAALPSDAGALVATSGSTGAPKLVVLSTDALRASGEATHVRLGGAGRWLLALPAHHIAGLQVVARSVLAGTTPTLLPPGPFTGEAFTAAATKMLAGDDRAYVSLVPTQLGRLIADDAARPVLARFSAVLIGGAALNPGLAQQAADAGVNIVRTYGMSETSGGCVYDGVGLDGVQWRIEDDGRILLTGPMLASGYLGDTELSAESFPEIDGTRWFRTSDFGREVDGRLEVLGRIDDVIISGGVNIAPVPIEAALGAHPEVSEAAVVGVPDPQWGQAVIALAVGRFDEDELRESVRQNLGGVGVPKRIFSVDELPALESGKIDRGAAQQMAAALYGSHSK